MILPRLLDVVSQFLAHMTLPMGWPNAETDLFVLDFTYVFCQIPLHPSERKFLAAMIVRDRTKHFLIFGSRQSLRTVVLGEVGRTPDAAYSVLFAPA